MGITYTTIKLRNPLTNSDIVEIEAKVDSGATLLVLPEVLICRRLKIYPNPRSKLPMAEVE